MPNIPTIRDIGKALGLGKSTVQRALAGSSGISEETRQRVMGEAKRLGYQPNPLFSILGSQARRARQQTLSICYISRSSHQSDQPGQTQAGIDALASIRTHAELLGYQVERINPDEIGAGKRLMDVLYFRGYVGVIVGPVRTPDHEAILENTHLPVVCCYRIDPLPLHTVRPDITQMVRLAWVRTMAAGYRRIGAATGLHQPPIEDDSDRLGAVLQCQEAMLRKSERVPPLLAPMGDHKAMLKWYRQHKPDAVLGFSSHQYYVLKDAGIRIPEDTGYVSLHAPIDSPIAGIREPIDSITREALNLLDQLIRHHSVGLPKEPLHILLPGQWNDGVSLLKHK